MINLCKRILAFSLSIVLVLGLTYEPFAFADNTDGDAPQSTGSAIELIEATGSSTSIDIPTDITAEISITDGASVSVDGNVIGDVQLIGKDSTLSVSGNISTSDEYVHALDSGWYVMIDEDTSVTRPVSVNASNEANVVIEGNVTNISDYGVGLRIVNSTVSINGNVVTDGTVSSGIDTSGQSKIDVAGDVISTGIPIYTSTGMGNSTPPTVTVGGDVNGTHINIMGGNVTIGKDANAGSFLAGDNASLTRVY